MVIHPRAPTERNKPSHSDAFSNLNHKHAFTSDRRPITSVFDLFNCEKGPWNPGFKGLLGLKAIKVIDYPAPSRFFP